MPDVDPTFSGGDVGLVDQAIAEPRDEKPDRCVRHVLSRFGLWIPESEDPVYESPTGYSHRRAREDSQIHAPADADVVQLLDGLYLDRVSLVRMKHLGRLLMVTVALLGCSLGFRLDQIDAFGGIPASESLAELRQRAARARDESSKQRKRGGILTGFARARRNMHELIRYGSLVTPAGVTVHHLALGTTSGGAPVHLRIELKVRGVGASKEAVQTYLQSLQVLAPAARLEPSRDLPDIKDTLVPFTIIADCGDSGSPVRTGTVAR